MEWTDVFYNGKETNLQVTTCGRVRKIFPNWSVRDNGKWKHKIGNIDFSILKTNKGYLWTSFMINGIIRKHAGVHQLIAAAFLKYQFDGMRTVIHHKDFNKLNNDVSNLIIVSNRENCSIEKCIKKGLPAGVRWDENRKKYESYFKIGIKKFHTGRYNTVEEAINARNNKLNSILCQKEQLD